MPRPIPPPRRTRLAGLATCEATFRVQVLQLAVLGPTNGVARIDDDANSFRGQLIIARAWATTNVGQVPPQTSLTPGHLLHPKTAIVDICSPDLILILA